MDPKLVSTPQLRLTQKTITHTHVFTHERAR